MSIAADCQDFFPISEGNETYNNEYVIGEFTFKWFEEVVGVAIFEVNNYTVCDTCSYRVKIVDEWEVYPGIAATNKASNFAAPRLPLKEINKPKHTVP